MTAAGTDSAPFAPSAVPAQRRRPAGDPDTHPLLQPLAEAQDGVARLEPTLDRDALEALAWIESDMPDSQVAYGPDAPKLTEEQRREFEPASYVRAPAAATARRRTEPAK
jgi:hypothetical protein